MALNISKCDHLTPLRFKGLKRKRGNVLLRILKIFCSILALCETLSLCSK